MEDRRTISSSFLMKLQEIVPMVAEDTSTLLDPNRAIQQSLILIRLIIHLVHLRIMQPVYYQRPITTFLSLLLREKRPMENINKEQFQGAKSKKLSSKPTLCSLPLLFVLCHCSLLFVLCHCSLFFALCHCSLLLRIY